MKRKHFTYYLFGIALLFPLMISSQALVIKEFQVNYTLRDHLSFALDQSNGFSFEALPAADSLNVFQTLPINKEPDLESPYIGKLQLENRLPFDYTTTEWVLKFSLIFTDIDVYIIDDLGNVQTGKSGFFTALPERTFTPNIKANIVKVSLLPNRVYTIYFKLSCERTVFIPDFDISLIPAEKYITELSTRKEQNALYYGFVLMILFYNLILYFFTRDKASIFYSIYLGGLLLFIAYNSGSLADWLTNSLFPQQPQLIHFCKLFTYIGIAGYLTFVRVFMDLYKQLPTWDTIFKWLSILALPALLLDAYLMTTTKFSYHVADYVTNGYAALFVLSVLTIIIPLLRLKDKRAYFIVFGIIVFSVGILLTIRARSQNVDFSTLYLKIGSVFEIMSFSLGLAYRRLLEERERQQARFQLVKSKLIQEQEQKEADRLKDLDNLKSRLYTNITHEFRTPLTVIMGINNQIVGNDKSKDLISRNSKNLLRLINQMLDLAKAEEGKLKLELVNNDIINYLRYLNESFLSAAETKNIKLTFYTETPQLMVDYDENKIQHIIQNLLSNAIKFTSEYGTIVFHTKVISLQNDTYLQLKIKDSGIGISEEEIPFIFDRFYQSDNTSTRSVGGTGIGLALTKELVHLMGGKIKVESNLGKGSEFIVHLPYEIDQQSTKVKAVSDAIPVPLSLDKRGAIATSNLPPEPIASNLLSTIQDLEKIELPLLLIIEDNEDVLTYIETCLDQAYTIEVARNGQEGIDKALEIIPDIIISDVMMPIKDGFEVTQILKKDSKTSHIPIIILTAKATQENKLKGLKHGADAYLMKPFDKEELMVRLEKLVELRNRLHAHYAKGDFLERDNSTKKPNAETIFLKELHQIIQEHLTESEFSVPQIARIMNMSQVQVYRKLKALTGKTPTKYIRAIRMEKAMNLLMTTNLNISEIAYDLGFSDPNYFSRTFQQVYGKTPSSIRK